MSSIFFSRCGFTFHRVAQLTEQPKVWLIRTRNFSGCTIKKRSQSSGPPSFTSSSFNKGFDNIFRGFLNRRRKPLWTQSDNMGYFVIGVSGVTCGGKTTLTRLLLKKFPWALVIHQDHYFYDDDDPRHIRVPEAENHVNYEILEALDMEKMYKDVQAILSAPPQFKTPSPVKQQLTNGVGDKAEVPNFDEDFFHQIPEIEYDVSKYSRVPILLIEGFTIFASEYLYGICDARFFCSLDKETCRQRRSLRNYFPPDTPNFFEKVVWPEYEKHFENFIQKRPGITVFDGKTLMEELWKTSLQIITCRIEEKFGGENANNVTEISA